METHRCYLLGNILRISLLNVHSSILQSVPGRHSYIHQGTLRGLKSVLSRTLSVYEGRRPKEEGSQEVEEEKVNVDNCGHTVIVDPTTNPDFYFLAYYILQEIRW